MDIDQNARAYKPAPNVLAGQAQLASRLAAIRAELSTVISAPYAFGRAGPHRRRRDEDILRAFAADIAARLIEARAAR
jgi:hypothetical protein